MKRIICIPGLSFEFKGARLKVTAVTKIFVTDLTTPRVRKNGENGNLFFGQFAKEGTEFQLVPYDQILK